MLCNHNVHRIKVRCKFMVVRCYGIRISIYIDSVDITRNHFLCVFHINVHCHDPRAMEGYAVLSKISIRTGSVMVQVWLWLYTFRFSAHRKPSSAPTRPKSRKVSGMVAVTCILSTGRSFRVSGVALLHE